MADGDITKHGLPFAKGGAAHTDTSATTTAQLTATTAADQIATALCLMVAGTGNDSNHMCGLRLTHWKVDTSASLVEDIQIAESTTPPGGWDMTTDELSDSVRARTTAENGAVSGAAFLGLEVELDITPA